MKNNICEVNVFKELNLEVAISDKQALIVKEKINYDSDKIILDFKNITDVTTAFLNIIMDGFFEKITKPEEVVKKLKFKNHNDSVIFAFGDAYELFKKRFNKKRS